MATCDKCGKDVPLSNDAVALQSLIEYGTLPNPFMVLNYGSRHLLPVEGCEGSPSRAQFIEGQPRDARIDIYTSTLEQLTRAAYQKLLELTTTPKMGFEYNGPYIGAGKSNKVCVIGTDRGLGRTILETLMERVDKKQS